MRAAFLALTSLVLAGCAGSVSLDSDDVDSFGPGTSGAYVVVDLDSDTAHFFVLANQGGICSKIQTAYAAAFAAWDDRDLADDESCDDYTAALADAWDPIVSGSAHFLGVTLNNGFDLSLDDIMEPSRGTWDVGDGEASLQLTYYPSGGSPYREVADRGDGCDLGDALEDADRAIDSFYATDGELELDEGSNDGWRIDFEVELDDEDADSAGDASGGFGAARCDVELDDLGPLEWVGNPTAFSPWFL